MNKLGSYMTSYNISLESINSHSTRWTDPTFHKMTNNYINKLSQNQSEQLFRKLERNLLKRPRSTFFNVLTHFILHLFFFLPKNVKSGPFGLHQNCTDFFPKIPTHDFSSCLARFLKTCFLTPLYPPFLYLTEVIAY